MKSDRWNMTTPGDLLHANVHLLKQHNKPSVRRASRGVGYGLWGETACRIHQEGKFRENILREGNEQCSFDMLRRLR